MPLESASYITTLVSTNPPDADPLGQVNQHVKLIKTVLQSTFPNLNGPVTSTPAALSNVGAIATQVGSLAASAMLLNASNTGTGSITLTGTASAVAAPVVNAGTVEQGGYPLIPHGVIVMFTGSSAPSGWHLCDGTGGTPDLRGMFIVGAGGSYSVGAAGGSATVAPAIHAAATGVTMAYAGAHNHTGAAGAYTLQIADIPLHTHTLSDPGHAHTMASSNGGPGPTNVQWIPYGGVQDFTATSLATTGIVAQSTGGSGSHTHGISADGGHVHTLTDGGHNHAIDAIDNRPPYYALAFIMKL